MGEGISWGIEWTKVLLGQSLCRQREAYVQHIPRLGVGERGSVFVDKRYDAVWRRSLFVQEEMEMG